MLELDWKKNYCRTDPFFGVYIKTYTSTYVLFNLATFVASYSCNVATSSYQLLASGGMSASKIQPIATASISQASTSSSTSYSSAVVVVSGSTSTSSTSTSSSVIQLD